MSKTAEHIETVLEPRKPDDWDGISYGMKEYCGAVRAYAIHVGKGGNEIRTNRRLRLRCPCLVFTLCTAARTQMGISIGLRTSSNTRARLDLSTAFKQASVTPLATRVPLKIALDGWLILAVDIRGLLAALDAGDFEIIESISVRGELLVGGIDAAPFVPGPTIELYNPVMESRLQRKDKLKLAPLVPFDPPLRNERINNIQVLDGTYGQYFIGQEPELVVREHDEIVRIRNGEDPTSPPPAESQQTPVAPQISPVPVPQMADVAVGTETSPNEQTFDVPVIVVRPTRLPPPEPSETDTFDFDLPPPDGA